MSKKVKIVAVEEKNAVIYEVDSLPFKEGYEVVYKNVPENGGGNVFSKEEVFNDDSLVSPEAEFIMKKRAIKKMADIVLILTIIGALIPIIVLILNGMGMIQ